MYAGREASRRSSQGPLRRRPILLERGHFSDRKRHKRRGWRRREEKGGRKRKKKEGVSEKKRGEGRRGREGGERRGRRTSPSTRVVAGDRNQALTSINYT